MRVRGSSCAAYIPKHYLIFVLVSFALAQLRHSTLKSEAVIILTSVKTSSRLSVEPPQAEQA